MWETRSSSHPSFDLILEPLGHRMVELPAKHSSHYLRRGPRGLGPFRRGKHGRGHLRISYTSSPSSCSSLFFRLSLHLPSFTLLRAPRTFDSSAGQLIPSFQSYSESLTCSTCLCLTLLIILINRPCSQTQAGFGQLYHTTDTILSSLYPESQCRALKESSEQLWALLPSYRPFQRCRN